MVRSLEAALTKSVPPLRAADLQQSLDLQESSDRLGDRAAAECPSGARVVSPERRPGASECLAGAVPVDARVTRVVQPTSVAWRRAMPTAEAVTVAPPMPLP